VINRTSVCVVFAVLACLTSNVARANCSASGSDDLVAPSVFDPLVYQGALVDGKRCVNGTLFG
jgi:hypothetical protein